jgi:hypothetical protein
MTGTLSVAGHGVALFALMCAHDIEGIVAKPSPIRTSPASDGFVCGVAR